MFIFMMRFHRFKIYTLIPRLMLIPSRGSPQGRSAFDLDSKLCAANFSGRSIAISTNRNSRE